VCGCCGGLAPTTSDGRHASSAATAIPAASPLASPPNRPGCYAN
jgi:hypothetical protein